jgi:hypothetical protein
MSRRGTRGIRAGVEQDRAVAIDEKLSQRDQGTSLKYIRDPEGWHI